jgi:hypothetical protein
MFFIYRTVNTIIRKKSGIRKTKLICITVDEGKESFLLRHNYGAGSLLNFEILLLSLGKSLNDCHEVFRMVPCDFLKLLYE